MRGLAAGLRAADPTVRLLCVNQFGINLGFYMLMPYLLAYLTGDVGMAVGAAGFLLGVRNLCQQGLFLVGGTIADRLGHKPMIVAGCALRTAAFAALALPANVPVLVAAMAATGVAGALFNPAVRGYIAARAGADRVEAFALFNVFYQAGLFAGPIVGVALTAFDFRYACLTAAGVFAVLTVAQARRLPAQDAGPAGPPTTVWADWRAVAANRRFLAFSLAMAASYVLGFQVYLALPWLVGGAPLAVTGLFAASALVTILGQARTTAWCRRRLGHRRAMPLGLAVMAAAFLPPLLVVHTGLGWRTAAAVLCAALLAAGTMIAYPFEMDTVSAMANGRTATYYGCYSTITGVAIAAGNLLLGAALDRTGGPLPWLVLIATGLAGALAVRALAPGPRAPEPVPRVAAAVN
ncbi:MFS transporter [Glycomyces mayteni]|uniref:MFS transporter n=1 Tax=Glycomyces mayteni TaxID=543887 RepID=A0ABW2D8K7_9ACTN